MALSGGSVIRSGQALLRPLERAGEAELLDGSDYDPAELAGNFRDIRRVNRLLGGVSTTISPLAALMDGLPADRPVTILDLGTGCGDIPIAILRWARRHGRAVEIIASDVDETILDLARAHTGSPAEIRFARYDARDVPLPDRSVDIAHCALSLHHFDPGDAVLVLREMHRLARHGLILNDLRRGHLGHAAAWVAARLTTRNRLTRNDAPLSVRRAYTPGELGELLEVAGVDHARVSTRPWFRMAAVAIRPTADA